jgi:hypothetical protein
LEFPAAWCYHGRTTARSGGGAAWKHPPSEASARASAMFAVGAGMLGESS